LYEHVYVGGHIQSEAAFIARLTSISSFIPWGGTHHSNLWSGGHLHKSWALEAMKRCDEV
jgi:hypothetical protein